MPLTHRVAKIVPTDISAFCTAWDGDRERGVAGECVRDRKLKDIVADFGLKAPYDSECAWDSLYQEESYGNRKCIQRNGKLDRKNSIGQQLDTKSHLLHHHEDSYGLNSGHIRTLSFPKITAAINQTLISCAVQVRSVFQCVTFKRDDQSKEKFSLEKSSLLLLGNQELSVEHLERMKVCPMRRSGCAGIFQKNFPKN